MIGRGVWSGMRHVVAGGDGILYAVDGAGRLLFFRDTTRKGTGEIGNPTVIAASGWSRFKHMTADRRGLIYAVPA